MKKYEFTGETKTHLNITLKRIRFLRDLPFFNIKKGDLGGWIEKEENLSQSGDCIVCDEAIVCGNAKVSGSARIYNNAFVRGNAKVFDRAIVRDNVIVLGNAIISGGADICDYSRIFDDALVTDCVTINSDARIYGNAKIVDYARIGGTAEIYGNAIISECQCIQTAHCISSIKENLEENIRCQTGLVPFNGKVIAYKQVNKETLTSFYDEQFVYKIGEWAEAKDPEESTNSCASGLHFSNANYWNGQVGADTAYLIAEINLEDIITVQAGKIRCRKAFIIGEYHIK